MIRATRIALLAAALAAGGTAAAARSEVGDVAGIANAKIPMTQAVAVAERYAGGSAARAGFEHSKRRWIYDVEVVSGARVFDVRVDARNGAVISSIEDKIEAGDGAHGLAG